MIQINLNLVFTIINLLVLYILMKKFLFGPVIRIMDQRKEMIDQQFEEAKKTEDRANQLQKQYENALKSAKEESYQIVEQAKLERKLRQNVLQRKPGFRLISCLPKRRQILRLSVSTP